MKKFILSLMVVLAGTLSLSAQLVEVDGLYFYVDGVAWPQQKPDGTPYTGKITIPESIKLDDGTEVPVYPNFEFTYSSLEEVIFDIPLMPVIDGIQRSLYCSFRNDNELRRLQFNKLLDPASVEYLNWNINTGNNPNCVYCYMRETETENLLIVEKFNLYDADGKQLRPCLTVEATKEQIYPDENNVFHLDKDWMYNGEYCMVLKLASGYYVVYLYGADENGNLAGVRTEPLLSQTGITAEQDGLCYNVLNDAVCLTGYNAEAALPTDLVVPDYVSYEGKNYPVTTIDENAFRGITVETITLPSTLTTVGNSPFYQCPDLKKVDMSRAQLTEIIYMFIDCANLEEVVLPQSCTSLFSTFYQCPALERVEIPESCKDLMSTFNQCPAMKHLEVPEGCNCSGISNESGLVEIETEWIDGETLKLTITHWGLSYIGGGEIEHYPFKTWGYGSFEDGIYNRVDVVYDGQPDGVSYLFKLSDFYTPDPNVTNPQYYGQIKVGVHNDYENEGGLSETVYASFWVPEPAVSGLNERVLEPADGPAQFFNLQGMEVDGSNLAPGLYIRRQGNTASKVMIR